MDFSKCQAKDTNKKTNKKKKTSDNMNNRSYNLQIVSYMPAIVLGTFYGLIQFTDNFFAGLLSHLMV